MRHTPSRMDATEPTRRAPRRRLFGVLVLLVLVAPLLMFFADRRRHAGRTWRGVRAGAVELSNLDETAARTTLTERAESLAEETISVRIGETTESVTLRQLGFQLDVDATLARALGARREPGLRQLRSWIASFRTPLDVGIVASLEAPKVEALLDRWERERVMAPFEGAIVVTAAEPQSEPPRAGHAVDREEARRAAGALVLTSERSWTLPLLKLPPKRSSELLLLALARAQELVASPIALYVDRGELVLPDESGRQAVLPVAGSLAPRDEQRITVTFSREQVLAALRSRLGAVPLGVEVYFDPNSLDPILGDLRRVVELPSAEPHFDIGPGERPHIVAGRIGREIKADSVAKALELASSAADRTGKLPIDAAAAPTSTVAELEALGITRLVANFTTAHPCCMPRVDNIHRIADLVDGVVVKPGELFSVNHHVGERTVEKGFKPAPTIVYGEMEDTIGGGISQFATTLFNAAFYGGYDIVERKPHSFYIPRYPMGHEATLSFPKPDLVIRNDTKAGLLIRCAYSRSAITVKLYGDNGGLHVRRKVSQVRDVVQPPVEYTADASLEPDAVKTKERGQVGWTVTVSRVIDFPDGTSRTEERKVTYQPRVRRVNVHPCKLPVGQKGHSDEPCPEPEGAPEDESHESTEAPADVPREGAAPKGTPIDDEG